MRELDTVLAAFFKRYGQMLSESQKKIMLSLLDEADHDLLSWITQKTKPTDTRYSELIDRIVQTRI